MNQNLDENDRWPRFAAEALDAGFRAAHALLMRLRGSVIGALNLVREGAGEVVPADVEIAQAFADIATIAILQHRATLEAHDLNQQLTHALNSRVILEQAKGMVAERLDLDMERSFATLRNHARNHNHRLSNVAQSVIDGSLATSGLDAPPDCQPLTALAPRSSAALRIPMPARDTYATSRQRRSASRMISLTLVSSSRSTPGRLGNAGSKDPWRWFRAGVQGALTSPLASAAQLGPRTPQLSQTHPRSRTEEP